MLVNFDIAGPLLVDQAKAVLSMMKAQDNLQRKMDEHKEKVCSYFLQCFHEVTLLIVEKYLISLRY